jgi:hypothetical protein
MAVPPVHRPPPSVHWHLPEGFQKCSFVDSLVGQRSFWLNAKY